MSDFKRELTLHEKKDIFVLIMQLVESCKAGIDTGQSRGMIIGYLIGSGLTNLERYTTKGTYNEDLEKCRLIALEPHPPRPEAPLWKL